MITNDSALCLGLFTHEGHFVQFDKDDDVINVMELRNYPTGDIESGYSMNPSNALEFQSQLIVFGYEQIPHYVLVTSNNQEFTSLD